MKLKNGKFYEVCEVCNKIFEPDNEISVIHNFPKDETVAELHFYQKNPEKQIYPHIHVWKPICKKCRIVNGEMK